VAANLCDVVEAVQAGTRFNRDIVMCHLAALRLSRHESYRGVGVESAVELTSGLKKILEKITSASTAADPAADEGRPARTG
jgi:phage tail tube protein FII